MWYTADNVATHNLASAWNTRLSFELCVPRNRKKNWWVKTKEWCLHVKNKEPTRYGTLSAADTFLQIFMICLQRLAQSATGRMIKNLLSIHWCGAAGLHELSNTHLGSPVWGWESWCWHKERAKWLKALPAPRPSPSVADCAGCKRGRRPPPPLAWGVMKGWQEWREWPRDFPRPRLD